jgi:large subunit ribosomal protein L10
MSKRVKELYIETLCTRFDGVQDCVVVGLAGLNAQQDDELRTDLRGKDVNMLVVKNRLASIALDRAGLGLAASLLDGPSAVAWGGDSIIELSKVMQKWANQFEPMVIRGGYSEGETLSADQVDVMSKMPSREELLGRVAGQLTASASRVVALATGPAGRVLGQIKTIGDDGDDGGDGEDGEDGEAAEAA